MNCHEYREQLSVHLAEGTGPGEHGAACADCARYAELARAAWDLAGRCPDEAVPAALSDSVLISSRRPRRTDLTLLRPGSLAAAAVLAVGAILFFWPAKAVDEARRMMDSDGMSVERYDLPAGVAAGSVAEEILGEVAPEAWGEGGSGLEVGEGWLRVHAPIEVQQRVKEFLKRYR
jgi:hypothetical protein